MSWFSRCSWCGGPFNGGNCRRCTNKWCGSGLSKEFCFICASSNGNSSIYDPNPNSFNDSQNFSYPPPQPQIFSYEQAANLRTRTLEFLQHFKLIYKGSTIPLNDMPQISLSVAITPDLPIKKPEDSLIMGDEELSTIPEKESDEVIKYSVEDFVPIPSESEDTSGSNSDLPSCDDFSPINVYEEKSMTFSNPLFNSNNDFTSSDDESLSDEDVPEDNVKIYSNPLFKFDDEYISSDVNPLFYEVLEDIKSDDTYVSKLDEPAFLVTPLFDANKNECFNLGDDIDEIKACLTSNSIPSGIDDADFDPEGDILLLEKVLNDDPSSLLPLKELYFKDFNGV
ncbi:hypothetical protein Tco_0979162 [Tanacetum coccineum]